MQLRSLLFYPPEGYTPASSRNCSRKSLRCLSLPCSGWSIIVDTSYSLGTAYKDRKASRVAESIIYNMMAHLDNSEFSEKVEAWRGIDVTCGPPMNSLRSVAQECCIVRID